MTAATPRRRPCASCPYRKNAPSGIWHEDEYAKLTRYDEETFARPVHAFMCHQGDGDVCSGWLGHGDPSQLLAVRIGIIGGHLDPSCADYSTDVDLFDSGRAAAEHGSRAIAHPDAEARQAIEKITRTRAGSALGEVRG